VVQRTLIAPPHSRLAPVTAKERAIVNSVSALDGKYDEAVDRESAEEVLAQKAADAAATATEVEEKGRREVGKRERKSTSLWGRAGRAAATAAAGSLSSVVVARVLGKKSSADPIRTGATAFVRNIIGGLMR
jgi:hypothetical protein